MPAFDYRQAREIRDTFAQHDVRYLFIGKPGAVLLGFPDTTQDADRFVQKAPKTVRHSRSHWASLESRLIKRGTDGDQRFTRASARALGVVAWPAGSVPGKDRFGPKVLVRATRGPGHDAMKQLPIASADPVVTESRRPTEMRHVAASIGSHAQGNTVVRLEAQQDLLRVVCASERVPVLMKCAARTIHGQ